MNKNAEFMQSIEDKVMHITGITPVEMFDHVFDSGIEFITKNIGLNDHAEFLKSCPVFWSWYRMKMYQYNQWFLRVMGEEFPANRAATAKKFYLQQQTPKLEKFSIYQSFHQLVDRII